MLVVFTTFNFSLQPIASTTIKRLSSHEENYFKKTTTRSQLLRKKLADKKRAVYNFFVWIPFFSFSISLFSLNLGPIFDERVL